jgi:thiol-disulfide isomerase/thioredoxin
MQFSSRYPSPNSGFLARHLASSGANRTTRKHTPVRLLLQAMRKSFVLVLLLATAAQNTAAQSGRRNTATRPTITAPVQPPANPEPEIRTVPIAPIAPSALHSLPEGLRARQIETLDRGSFRLADFQGKVLVINLWASWCGPCRREVPEYEKVRKEYHDRQVEFVGLTTEDPYTSAGRVKKFIRDTNFTFRIGWGTAKPRSSL